MIVRRGGGLIVGRLQDFGPAKYQFRKSEAPSYYIRLLTTRGERVLWGSDLERALLEGRTQPKAGDVIGARRLSRHAVTVVSRQRDHHGQVAAQEERQAHRTHWEVEHVKFFADRSQVARRLRDDQLEIQRAMRERPELKSTFLSIRAAEEFAATRIKDPRDRERFLQLVKGAMASSIRRGEPLPEVSLRRGRMRTQSDGTPSPPHRDPDDPIR
jgi:hypothetical protein